MLSDDYLNDLARLIVDYQECPVSSFLHTATKDFLEEKFGQLADAVRSEAERKDVGARLTFFVERRRTELGKSSAAETLPPMPDLGLDTILRFHQLADQESRLHRQLEAALDPEVFSGLALARADTPLQHINEWTQTTNWDDDAATELKTYIFACLSEVAYLQRSAFDVPLKDRYKIIPCETLYRLELHDIRFSLESAMRRTAEGVGVTVYDPGGGFVYTTFAFSTFVVIAIRGTHSLSDAFLDLSFRMEWLSEDAGYHGGFYREAMNAMPVLMRQDALKNNSGGKTLYFTGHSMGAAIAWILRNEWSAGFKLMTPYLYASPRIGNENVTRRNRVYSFVRRNDPIPLVPPFCLGYADPDPKLPADPLDTTELPLWQKISALAHHHAIEAYRVELGERVKEVAPTFPADAYFNALYAETVSAHKTFKQPPLF